MREIDVPPVNPVTGFQAVAYPADVVNLIDSRAIRAIRRVKRDAPALGLTREQKVALWVGVGIVAAYLIADWVEDEVAFFPE